MVPYKVVQSGDHVAGFLAQGKENTPPQISALILQKVEEGSGRLSWRESQRKRSLLCPLISMTPQRQATKDAGQIAGPRSEAHHQRAQLQPRWPTGSTRARTKTIAVYDFGGGTFDISILEVGEGRD